MVSCSPSDRSAARRSASRAGGDATEVGLGDDEHVGHLHDPGLQELQHVARAGLDDDRDRVGDVGDLGLGLANADGLDHDHVERGGERPGGGAGRRGEAAEPVARGGRADEHAAVGRIGLDPRAVAEQGAARAPGGGVDGQHRDRPVPRAPRRHQPREQRRLADAGRAGDADDVRGSLAAERRGRDGREQRVGLRARRRRAVLDQVQDRGRDAKIALAQAPRRARCRRA